MSSWSCAPSASCAPAADGAWSSAKVQAQRSSGSGSSPSRGRSGGGGPGGAAVRRGRSAGPPAGRSGGVRRSGCEGAGLPRPSGRPAGGRGQPAAGSAAQAIGQLWLGGAAAKSPGRARRGRAADRRHRPDRARAGARGRTDTPGGSRDTGRRAPRGDVTHHARRRAWRGPAAAPAGESVHAERRGTPRHPDTSSIGSLHSRSLSGARVREISGPQQPFLVAQQDLEAIDTAC